MSQLAQVDDVCPRPSCATQQYVLFGLSLRKIVMPFLPVFCVANGVPGRGLALERGVEICTGIWAVGDARIVTSIDADRSFGFGVSVGTGDVDGLTLGLLPLLQAAKARTSDKPAKRTETRLGMAGSVRRVRPPLRSPIMRGWLKA